MTKIPAVYPPGVERPTLTALGSLLTEVSVFVRRFVVVSVAQAHASALWTAHTHAFEAADATPYLSATSAEKRSGKTRLLEVLELLVARPWFTGRTTAAALARKVHQESPTLLLDESDAAFKGDKEYAETLRGLLNTGYRRGGKTTVCVVQGAHITYQDLNTFCPKAIAGIGRLPDTVADRSIPIRLERKTRTESVERFRRRDVEPEASALRDRIENSMGLHLDELRTARPELPPELDDRAQDVWEPLFALADAAGGDWPEEARKAALELSSGEAREDESMGIRLLADIRQVFASRSDRLSTAALLDELCSIDDAPWGDWFGKKMTGQALSRLLRPFHIKTQAVWSDAATVRGYKREQFEDAWLRYLPSEALGTLGPASDAAPELTLGLTPNGSGPETALGDSPRPERDLTHLTRLTPPRDEAPAERM